MADQARVLVLAKIVGDVAMAVLAWVFGFVWRLDGFLRTAHAALLPGSSMSDRRAQHTTDFLGDPGRSTAGDIVPALRQQRQEALVEGGIELHRGTAAVAVEQDRRHRHAVEARRFVREVEGRQGRRHESHTDWFRDRFRLLETAGRIDTGIDDVRNAVTAAVALESGDFTLVPAESYIESVRLALQAELEQAVAEIHRRWNTAPSPSAGIRL